MTLQLQKNLPNLPLFIGESGGIVVRQIDLAGTQSAVYATEVSLEEYVCYTTEETEKLELMRLTEKLGGNIELAIKQLAESKREK